jgi:SAM-dependent methyltransferase
MGTSSPVQRFGNALRTHGPWRTVRILGKRLHREFFPAPVPTHPFDLEHGVDTSGLLFAEHLASGHAHDDHINAYWGTAPSGFRGILEQWQQTLAGGIQDYTFLDIGCGKGRVLMLASDAPFQRIVGVELSPALTAIAESNMAKWSAAPHLCSNIDVLNVDALAAQEPQCPTPTFANGSGKLDKAGELRRIREAVSPYLEMAEIADRTAKLGKGTPNAGGPALLFENVTGYPGAQVLMNQFGSERRMKLALETDSLDAIADRIRDLIHPERPTSMMDKLKLLPKLAEVGNFFPKVIPAKDAACKQVIHHLSPRRRTSRRAGNRPHQAPRPHHLAPGRRPVHHAALRGHARPQIR